jgi:multiple sugar transport system permease protein
VKRVLKVGFLYGGLLIGALIVLFPFFWMMLTALKQPGTAMSYRFLPDEWSLQGLREIYTVRNFDLVWNGVAPEPGKPPEFSFKLYFRNSLLVAGAAAFFATLFATMGGYVFAKKKFWGRELLFSLLLGSMMIPGFMFMVPQFAMVNVLGKARILGIPGFLERFRIFGMDTYGAMIVPHLASVFGIFLLRQYLQTIPDSLIEVAKIDGASEWQIFTRIIVPLSLPIMLTLFLLTFIFHWSNFLWQLLVTTPGSDLTTLPVGLALFRGQYATRYEPMMAAACISLIPIAILFLFAQRFFIEGMTKGAVKG